MTKRVHNLLHQLILYLYQPPFNNPNFPDFLNYLKTKGAEPLADDLKKLY